MKTGWAQCLVLFTAVDKAQRDIINKYRYFTCMLVKKNDRTVNRIRGLINRLLQTLQCCRTIYDEPHAHNFDACDNVARR